MKKEFNIKDTVWIHLGERKLIKGRVVEIIDLAHLNEGHSEDDELYVIEIKTGIDDVYEVRSYGMISPDEKGPINAFRQLDAPSHNRYLKKLGMTLPVDLPDPLVDLLTEINEDLANGVPPKEINRKRRYFGKKKKTTDG